MNCVFDYLLFCLSGLSLITNMVVMDIDTDAVEPNHEEVLETSKRRALDMQRIVKTVIAKMNIS